MLQCRRNLARLKRGVPPVEAIDFLAIGVDRLQQQLGALFSEQTSPRWFAVTGEYGEGKSFVRAFACRRALDAGFAVASLDVNKDEGALHQPQRHLSVILRSLQSPLNAFVGHQGMGAILRHWLTHQPFDRVQQVLNGLRQVVPNMPVGCDSANFHIAVDALFSRGGPGSVASHAEMTSAPGVILDDHGIAYKQFGPQGIIYRRVSTQSDWQYYGGQELWPRLVAQYGGRETSRVQHEDVLPNTVNPYGLAAFLRFLSAEDLVAKSTYARFNAAYRMQLVVDWLRLTGHRGLFLFVDELDNVVRQISERGHPACFRTLAWYCSNRATSPLRVVFAITPEVMSLLDNGYRRQCAQALHAQKSVTLEEYNTYLLWSREADTLAANGWDKCVTLNYRQRIELYRRIVELHRHAWGASCIPSDSAVEDTARSPNFHTTRRWVRACVQLLDVCQQHCSRGVRSAIVREPGIT